MDAPVIRMGTAEEMQRLWYTPGTTEFFCEKLRCGEAEFWAIALGGRLVGELYLFLNLGNEDFADGEKTAYLCAFRIEKGLRGRGLGTRLISRVLDRMRELGFCYATIGVEAEEEGNVRLYQRLGFTEKTQKVFFDPCTVDSNFQPLPCLPYELMRKKL